MTSSAAQQQAKDSKEGFNLSETKRVCVLDLAYVYACVEFEGVYEALMAWMSGQGIDPVETSRVEVSETGGVLTGEVTEYVRDDQGRKVVLDSGGGRALKRVRTVPLTSRPPTIPNAMEAS